MRLVALLLSILTAASCTDAARATTREAVATGLLAGSGGSLEADEIRTFQAEVAGDWAIAYDPVSPPGCTPGGLWGAPSGPALPASPCAAYVLKLEKNRWRLVGSGTPGTFAPPPDAPKGLGEAEKLSFLAE